MMCRRGGKALQRTYDDLGGCTAPQNFKLRPMRSICFDLVKACEGVFLLCVLGQIVT